MLRHYFDSYYGGTTFVKVCRAKAIVYNNAQAESFFSRFKAELIEDGVFEDLEQARSEVFSYLEGYDNR